LLCFLRIEAEVELVLPTKLKPRFAQSIVAVLRAGMTFCEISRVGRELVGYDAFLYVLFVRQTEMFLWRNVTKHCRSVPAYHRRADTRRNVIVARCDVGRQRAERVERSLTTNLELLVHILLDQVHGNVSGSLDHRLTVHFPSDAGELAERVKLCKLCFVVGVGDRARS